jgi:hypothetical protein
LNSLAIRAFREVLRKRQSKYVKVLAWIDLRIGGMTVKERRVCEGMERALRR